jgi:hypothetical protein
LALLARPQWWTSPKLAMLTLRGYLLASVIPCSSTPSNSASDNTHQPFVRRSCSADATAESHSAVDSKSWWRPGTVSRGRRRVWAASDHGRAHARARTFRVLLQGKDSVVMLGVGRASRAIRRCEDLPRSGQLTGPHKGDGGDWNLTPVSTTSSVSTPEAVPQIPGPSTVQSRSSAKPRPPSPATVASSVR